MGLDIGNDLAVLLRPTVAIGRRLVDYAPAPVKLIHGGHSVRGGREHLVTVGLLGRRCAVRQRVEGARFATGSARTDRSRPDELCLEALPGVSPEGAEQMVEAIADLREVASVTQHNGPCAPSLETDG